MDENFTFDQILNRIMAAISTAKHFIIINKIKELSLNEKAEEPVKNMLQADAEQLQTIFEKYNGSLVELNTMIKEYEIKIRKAKVQLRKHQLMLSKQVALNNQ